MFASLVSRLRDRLLTEPSTDLEVCPPIQPNPPVTESDLIAAEGSLGFPLPPLVRELYAQVADGGYGPGYGLIRLSAGDSMTVVISGQIFREERDANASDRQWPTHFIELVGWGCNIFSGIDCSQPSCPVIRYVPDRAIRGGVWADCLIPEAETLAGWLEAWLDGEQLWERVSLSPS
jgi:hypothetical protein